MQSLSCQQVTGAHCSPLQGTQVQGLKSTAPRWALRVCCGVGSVHCGRQFWRIRQPTGLPSCASWRFGGVQRFSKQQERPGNDQTSAASKSTEVARCCPDVHCCRVGRHTHTLGEQPDLWDSVFDATAGALAFRTHSRCVASCSLPRQRLHASLGSVGGSPVDNPLFLSGVGILPLTHTHMHSYVDRSSGSIGVYTGKAPHRVWAFPGSTSHNGSRPSGHVPSTALVSWNCHRMPKRSPCRDGGAPGTHDLVAGNLSYILPCHDDTRIYIHI